MKSAICSRRWQIDRVGNFPKRVRTVFMKKLTSTQIKTARASLPDWKKKSAAVTRTYQFKDFPAAIKFVNAAAKLAEKAWHHPDIDIRWNKVTLVLTTHSEGGLTEKDFKLAKQFDSLV